MDESFIPFRWDMTQRHQLGALIHTSDVDFDAWLNHSFSGLGRLRVVVDHAARPLDWLIDELTHAATHIFSRCDNADLYFVGRSPESLFDLISGIVHQTSWERRIQLLHFSLRTPMLFRNMWADSMLRQSLQSYFTHLHLTPHHLRQRTTPIAFVDVVATGTTMGSLIQFLAAWCRETAVEWHHVRQKLRILGLTVRTKTSPNTWRWQQHADWVSLLPKRAIKNTSIPAALFEYIGAVQTKTTPSFHPGRWRDPQMSVPRHDPATSMALRLAVTLYDCGRSPTHRARVARRMSSLPTMRERWFRDLRTEVQRSSRTTA
jgi:hypothetical protein